MGAARPRPRRLAEKLGEIRNTLGLSQSELLRHLRVEDEIPYTRISDCELDIIEPTLMVLLEYARVARRASGRLLMADWNNRERLPAGFKHITPNKTHPKR